MTIIISIIIVVALISLYDYFSAKNWQQVTSEVRNEVVFEKRNKAYGAYVIRRDYNKRMILIMASLVGGMGATYGAYMAVRSTPELAVVVTPPDGELDTLIIDFDVIKPEIPEIEKVETESAAKTDAFPELVVEDDPTKPLPPLPEGKNKIGDNPIDGEGTNVIPVILPPDPPVVIIPITPVGPFTDVDEAAQFPGGNTKMIEFLMKNLQYPEIAQVNGIGGKCYLRFVVGKDGEISRIRVTRGLDDCPECEKEAMRVIRKMPPWRPGKVNGEPVDSYFDMPINFVVIEDN